MNKTPTKTWKQKSLKWVAEIIILVVLFNVFSLYLSRDMLKGQAIAINTLTIDGKPINTKHYNNQTYMLYFWGSWCPVCKLTKGNVQTLSKYYPVVSFAIASGDNATIQSYLSENQLTFTTVNDEMSYWANQYNVVGVPAFFVINKKGNIIFAEKGYSSTLGLWLKLMYADYFS